MNDTYFLIDSGDGKKLEQFSKYRLIRPSSSAVWDKHLSDHEWDKADAIFERKEGEKWSYTKKLPSSWEVILDNIKFKISLTDFGHLGVFPEHMPLWKWSRKKVSGKKDLNILNLFAYSGGATMALAQEGAKVCHLDASRPMVSWARENAKLNNLDNKPIRWIVDDVFKFLKREVKRNVRYDGIILDPPTFGRGTKNEIFKIENDIVELLKLCKDLMTKKPLFLILSCHTPGFSSLVLKNLLSQIMKDDNIISHEMKIDSKESFSLPSGNVAIWERK